jgi:hypothetical protein
VTGGDRAAVSILTSTPWNSQINRVATLMECNRT